MAKKSYGVTSWKDGKPASFGELPSDKPTRAQTKSTQTLIPFTKGPATKRAKIARSLWG